MTDTNWAFLDNGAARVIAGQSLLFVWAEIVQCPVSVVRTETGIDPIADRSRQLGFCSSSWPIHEGALQIGAVRFGHAVAQLGV